MICFGIKCEFQTCRMIMDNHKKNSFVSLFTIYTIGATNRRSCVITQCNYMQISMCINTHTATQAISLYIIHIAFQYRRKVRSFQWIYYIPLFQQIMPTIKDHMNIDSSVYLWQILLINQFFTRESWAVLFSLTHVIIRVKHLAAITLSNNLRCKYWGLFRFMRLRDLTAFVSLLQPQSRCDSSWISCGLLNGWRHVGWCTRVLHISDHF